MKATTPPSHPGRTHLQLRVATKSLDALHNAQPTPCTSQAWQTQGAQCLPCHPYPLEAPAGQRRLTPMVALRWACSIAQQALHLLRPPLDLQICPPDYLICVTSDATCASPGPPLPATPRLLDGPAPAPPLPDDPAALLLPAPMLVLLLLAPPPPLLGPAAAAVLVEAWEAAVA